MGRRNRVLDGDPPAPCGKGPGTFGAHAWLFRDLSAVDILSIVRKGAAVMRRLAAGACVYVAVCVCRLQPLYAADPREHPLLSPDERRTPGHEGMRENMSLQFQLGNFFELAVECFAVSALMLFVGWPVKN